MRMAELPQNTWKTRSYFSLLLMGAICVLMVEHRDNLIAPLTISELRMGDFDTFGRKDASAGKEQNSNVFHTLVDAYRTLWTAGWNARYTQYYYGAPPKVIWSPEAEDIVEREYRRLHFPADCAGVKGWLVVNTYNWGVMSAARDYQSDILRALAMNYTLVHQGTYEFCPPNPLRYLDCFWEDLNGCQAKFPALHEIPRINQPQEITTSAVTRDQFPHWLWDLLVNRRTIHLHDGLTGAPLTEEDVVDRDQYLQLKLSVLRAILSKTIFKPRAHIQQKTLAMLEAWRANETYASASEKGVVIHIRRTDKMIDLGAHWRYIDFESTVHLGHLIQTMESMIKGTFGHFFVMSDDPNMQRRGTQELASYFRANPANLISTELCDLLGANKLEYSGHESLEVAHRKQLYDIVVAEMYAAIEVSQYIIGSGSCAVSQFMALNIGARHRVEPGLIAMWEEDIIVKECRSLLQQRIRAHEPCYLSAALEPTSDNLLTQNVLVEQWQDKGCAHFSPPLPVCLSEPG